MTALVVPGGVISGSYRLTRSPGLMVPQAFQADTPATFRSFGSDDLGLRGEAGRLSQKPTSCDGLLQGAPSKLEAYHARCSADCVATFMSLSLCPRMLEVPF